LEPSRVGIEALREIAMQIDRSLHGAPTATALSHCRDSVPKGVGTPGL
jgi:hypothetical protein